MPRGTRKFVTGKWERPKKVVPCIPYPVFNEVANLIIKGSSASTSDRKQWKKIDRYVDMLRKRVCPITASKRNR